MAASSYDAALAGVLAHEGGYVNHPSDPGGPTKYGITIATYRTVKPGATAAQVRAMTRDEAKAIYRARYWDALRCDDLPAGVDYAVFDYGVNSGIGRAGMVLRRLLRLSDATGGVDAGVIAAARAKDAASLVDAICDERLAFLKRLDTWDVFGAGWSRRVADVRRSARALSPATSAPAKPAFGKAAPLGKAAPIGGVVAGGAVIAAQQSHAAGATPLMVLFATLAVAAIGIAIWLAWRSRQARRQEA